MTHRDQVHGDVRYDPLAVALLDTAVMQRLGRVYQLGFTHLVYRGGNHTRLSHVLGAYNVAGRLVDLLKENYGLPESPPKNSVTPEEFLPMAGTGASIEQRWDILLHLVRWAALLHDAGHVPLGHTLEDEFEGLYAKHDSVSSPRTSFIWVEQTKGRPSEIRSIFAASDVLPRCFTDLKISGETVAQAVFLICMHKPGKEKLIDQYQAGNNEEPTQAVSDYCQLAYTSSFGSLYLPYMSDLVANTICADYLDYLRRDPMNVGLDVLKDDRVASRFFVGRRDDELRMALALTDRRGKPRLDTCTGVVDLVRQRYRFAEIIYYHKTKVAASAMLARALTLLGKPIEVNGDRQFVDLETIDTITREVAKRNAAEVASQFLPKALMDIELGDDSLLLWLEYDAWSKIEDARKAKDHKRIGELLLALSLIHGVLRRNLYKVAFTLNRGAIEQFNPGIEGVVDSFLRDLVKRLRTDHAERARVEQLMAEAAGWTPGACLLYVPPPKSQAKGIETMANADGNIVTLQEHPAVAGEVAELNRAYAKLWRLIVLVHPSKMNDVLALSKAIDCLLGVLFSSIHIDSNLAAVERCCWFDYAPQYIRAAFSHFKALGGVDFTQVSVVRHALNEHTTTSQEHGEYAYLLDIGRDRIGANDLFARFPSPGTLSACIEEKVASKGIVEGREGEFVDLRRSALRDIAAEMQGGDD